MLLWNLLEDPQDREIWASNFKKRWPEKTPFEIDEFILRVYNWVWSGLLKGQGVYEDGLRLVYKGKVEDLFLKIDNYPEDPQFPGSGSFLAWYIPTKIAHDLYEHLGMTLTGIVYEDYVEYRYDPLQKVYFKFRTSTVAQGIYLRTLSKMFEGSPKVLIITKEFLDYKEPLNLEVLRVLSLPFEAIVTDPLKRIEKFSPLPFFKIGCLEDLSRREGPFVWIENQKILRDPLPEAILSNPEKRYIAGFYLIRGYRDRLDHANAFVYDRKAGTVERYDPSYQKGDHWDISFDDLLRSYYRRLGVTYIGPKDFSPPEGAQTLEKVFFDLDATCLLWSYFYILKRLKTKKSREEVAINLAGLILRDSHITINDLDSSDLIALERLLIRTWKEILGADLTVYEDLSILWGREVKYNDGYVGWVR